MLAVLLAVLSALAYGTSDFLGGILTRRRVVWMVTLGSEVAAAVCTTVVACFSGGHPVAADWWHAVAAGASVCLGTACLYRGLARGRMTVVAPISALGSAVVPAVWGVIEGNRPDALGWIGMVLVAPAILLVTHAPGAELPADRGSGEGQRLAAEPTTHSSGAVDGVLAGLGFGVMFCLIGGMSSHAGLFPMAVIQVAAAAVAVPCALASNQLVRPARSDLLPLVAMGALSATALGLFFFASQRGMLAEVSVITALYPAITVVLAANLLKEAVGRVQLVGLLVAAAAVGLVAAAT